MHRNDFDTFDELVRGKLSGYIEPPEMESLNRIHAKKARVASLYQLYRLFAVLLVAGLGMFTSTLFLQQSVGGDQAANATQQVQPSTIPVDNTSTVEFASTAGGSTTESSSASVSDKASRNARNDRNVVASKGGSQSSSASKVKANPLSGTSTPAAMGASTRSSRSTSSAASLNDTKRGAATSSNTRTTTTPQVSDIPTPTTKTSPAPTSSVEPVKQTPETPTTNDIRTDSVSKVDGKDDNSKDETCEVAFNFYGSYTGALTFYSSLPASSTAELRWDFGDGETSTETSPVHTYKKPGAYTVSLVLTNAGKQCQAQASREIVMNATTIEEPRNPLTLNGSLLAGNDVVSNGLIEVYELNSSKGKYTSARTVKTKNDGSFSIQLSEGVSYLIKGYPTEAYPNYEPTFWGNTTSDNDASEIVVTPGEQLDLLGYNIKLNATEHPLPEIAQPELPVSSDQPVVRNDNQVILVDADNNIVGMGHVDQNGKIVANQGTKAGSYTAVSPSSGKTSAIEVSNTGAVIASTTIQSPTLEEKVAVFPNPVDNMVTFGVTSSESENAVLIVMNAAGFELIRKSISFTSGLNNMQYDISQFSPGIYYVMVLKDNHQVMSNRIVKTADASK